MFNNWTPEQCRAMREGIAWHAAHPGLRNLAESDKCVNWGAPECTGLAEHSGWCEGCAALLFPSGFVT